MFVAQHCRRLLALGVLGWVWLLAAPQNASAAIIFDMDTVITGSTPSGTPPWLKVTFANAGTNQVTMTIQNLLQNSSEFAADFYFNVDPAITGLTITHTGGQAPQSISAYSQGAYGNPSFGNDYDVRIDFVTANNTNRFTAGETSVYLLTATGLTENSFSFTTPSNNGPQYVASHIQGIAGGLSGRIGTTGLNGGTGGNGGPDGTPVPEPATLAVFGLMAGAGAIGYRLRRRKGAE